MNKYNYIQYGNILPFVEDPETYFSSALKHLELRSNGFLNFYLIFFVFLVSKVRVAIWVNMPD